MKFDRVVMVTGASRGIGAWVSRWLALAGATVALVARSQQALQQVAAEVEARGGKALVLPADVADPDACHKAVDATLEHAGRLDALVNNAGMLEPLARIAQADPQQWRDSLCTNLLGPLHLIRYSLAYLRQTKGRVINVSSGAALKTTAGWSAYSTGKAALNQLTRVLAAEEPSITAIAFRPGVVDTRMLALILKNGPQAMDAEKIAYFQRLKDEGQLLPPEVPARSIAWLALQAPPEWSGRFMSYDDQEIAGSTEAFFGDAE